MNVTAFNDSAIMKKVSFEIDKQPLDTEGVVTAEVVWSKSIFAITGYLIVKDNLDTANLLPLNGENNLLLYSEDNFDDFFFKSFRLTNVTEIRYKERHKALMFNFVDVLTYTMMNTFVGKSYKNKKLSDIIKDYFNNYNWGGLLDPHVELELLDTEKVHDYITVPQDRNFLEFIKKELEKEGYTMYQTRKKIVIGAKKENLLPSKLNKIEHSFSQLHTLAEHPFRIHEHNNSFLPVLEMSQNNPLADLKSFDYDSKTMISNITSFKDVFDKVKTATGSLKNIQSTIGSKLGSITGAQVDKVATDIQEGLLKTNRLSVVVTGNYKHNAIYQNADVILSGNLESKQGQLEGDVTMSGLYTIVAVTDKFINGKLIQRVNFERANFQENK